MKADKHISGAGWLLYKEADVSGLGLYPAIEKWKI